jgi:DNA end-binding protein Ku
MARALWKGSIAFGLVNIPVELHTAVHDHRPRFRLLHASDQSPIQLTRVCVRDGKPVAWDDLVKGYEYTKGHFVVLTKQDFEAAALEKTRTVDILDFVEAEEIDDRFFETPYYLLPAKGGERAYALLREALRETKRIGIAKFILRDALHLAAIEVIGDALVLTLMRFADELVDTEQLSLPGDREVRKQELDIAKMLVDNLKAPWEPSKYTDEYRDNLMRVIKAKTKGKKAHLEAPEQHRDRKVVDLMERLRASLSQSSSRSSKQKSKASSSKAAAGAHRRTRHASRASATKRRLAS